MSRALTNAGSTSPAVTTRSDETLFDLYGDLPISPGLRRSIWRPALIGLVVIAAFVVGGIAWAATFSIAGAIVAPSFVKVEANRKSIRHRDGGIVKELHVQEGDKVEEGQVLMVLDDILPRTQVEVYESQQLSLLGQRARYLAEAENAADITFPPELLARKSEPQIAAAMRDQTNLFQTRRRALEGQYEVLRTRMEQLRTRIGGVQGQIKAVARQSSLIEEELRDLNILLEKNLTPRTRVLAMQRAAAELAGQEGNLQAEVTRSQQAIGETELQLAQLGQQRSAEVAEGLRDAQLRLADVTPRLQAARETAALTIVRSPVAGYVLNLTQFTIGGVISPGERLADVVPIDAALRIEARIRPDDVHSVRAGMAARVKLLAYAARNAPPVHAEVVTISADRLQDQRSGEPYFTAELSLTPKDLADLQTFVRVVPGMPAMAMIDTGERSILSYLTSPITDGLRQSLVER